LKGEHKNIGFDTNILRRVRDGFIKKQKIRSAKQKLTIETIRSDWNTTQTRLIVKKVLDRMQIANTVKDPIIRQKIQSHYLRLVAQKERNIERGIDKPSSGIIASEFVDLLGGPEMERRFGQLFNEYLKELEEKNPKTK